MSISITDAARAREEMVFWLNQVRPEVLNVAGPRESNAPDIQDETYEVLVAALAKIVDRRLRPSRETSVDSAQTSGVVWLHCRPTDPSPERLTRCESVAADEAGIEGAT